MEKDVGSNEIEMTRFSISLPVSLNEMLQKIVPWGSKQNFMLTLIDKIVEEAVKENPSVFVSDILDGKFKIVCETVEQLKKNRS